MQFQFTPYALPVIAAAAISTWVAFYSWRHRSTHGAVALTILAAAIAEWAFAYAIEMMGADLPTKILWGKWEYLGIVVVPLAWMVFAFNYANLGKRLDDRVVVFLAVIAATTFVLTLTTEFHGLVWNEMHIEQGAGFSVLGVSHGPWFLVHLIYSYILLLVGTFFILRVVARKQGVYRGQAVALVIAVAAPWVANIAYLSGWSLVPLLDLTPFAFTITIAAVTWAIFGFQLLALSPIARDNIVDEMLDGVIVIDAQNRVADINPSALQIIGIADENVIGKPVVEILSPWPELVEKYKDSLNASDQISFGEQKDLVWYELRLSPLYDKRKRFIGRVITIRDITTYKQAEEFKHSFLEDMRALQEIHLALSEIEDLDTLYMNMISLSQQRLGIDRLGLFVINENTDELQGTYGVDEDGSPRDESYYHEPLTSLQWPWEILNSPNHAKVWENAEIYDNGEVVGLGWKAGATLWNGHKAIGYLACDNFVTKKAIRPYESELISLLGSTFGHLIERKRVEVSLQDSEARYRQIVENAGDIIYRADIHGRFTYINPTGLHLMGLTNDVDLLGTHYLDWVAPNFRHTVKRFYDRQYIAKQKNTYQEFPTIPVNGREIWLGQNVQLIEAGGQIIGFQAVARDITDLVKAKDALALARDQALEASQIKSRLLAKVSHELRTPLAGILGYAELLHNGAFGFLEEKQREAASQIIESADYLTNVVNELLDQAQVESKSLTLRMSLFNLREMVQLAQASTVTLADKKGLALKITLTPDAPEVVYGDRQRLQQILINLVSNAIKFTKTGEVCINVYSTDDTHWVMQVADTGAGIPEEAHEYIFEPFRQVNNAITRENRGTGLGLSITKQLVDLMGGQITLESEVDKGSVFTVTLPILKEKETEKTI